MKIKYIYNAIPMNVYNAYKEGKITIWEALRLSKSKYFYNAQNASAWLLRSGKNYKYYKKIRMSGQTIFEGWI